MPLDLSIVPALSDCVRLAVLVLEDLAVREADAALTAEMDAACRHYRERFAGTPSGAVPGAQAARRLYKALGLDPTKTRPSNESLLRRALAGKPLHRVNTLVDAVNLCSLVEQLPYGLYDLARVEPPIVLRLGAAGEGYEGIHKGFVHVAERPSLVDRKGPCGNPTSDSLRASITLATRAALVIVYAPADLAAECLRQVSERSAEVVRRHNPGRLVEQRLVPGGD